MKVQSDISNNLGDWSQGSGHLEQKCEFVDLQKTEYLTYPL
jgi:hypothetical protein